MNRIIEGLLGAGIALFIALVCILAGGVLVTLYAVVCQFGAVLLERPGVGIPVAVILVGLGGFLYRYFSDD